MPAVRQVVATTFRSLRVRNFRLWFWGQGLSSIGTWIHSIGQGWLILELTHNSGAAVGGIIAANAVPTLLLGSWAGVVADRADKRRMLMRASFAQTIAASLLAVLTLTGAVRVWMVFALAVALGLGQVFDSPARLAFTPEMVGPDEVPNAVSLANLLFQGGRVFGPAVAGVVIVTVGTGWCFALNALSFVILIGALLRIRPEELHRSQRVVAGKGQIREGFRYVWHTPLLRNLMLHALVVGTFAINNQVLLPLVAKLTFHGDAGTFSAMTTTLASGAFVAGLVLAHRGRATLPMLIAASTYWGTAICIEALAPSLTMFLILLMLAGVGQTAFLVTHQSLIQLSIDRQMAGRVMSVWSLAMLGSSPFGGPFVGWLSTATSPRVGVAVGGVGILFGVAAFLVPSLVVARRSSVGLEHAVVGEVGEQ